ncbi:unnamed protein product [Symbiodinium sp. CCMP2592]|nr:unnamed protein product [Symbiodinium sp. CCMP2592]
MPQRSYVVCCNKACNSWLWTDRCSKHTHCSQCNTLWAKSLAASGQTGPLEGQWPRWESARWKAPKVRKSKVQPPPGLDTSALWPADVLEALKVHWGSFDSKLQATLKSHGIHCSPVTTSEPDLKEACRQHLSSLPESIQKLLQEPKQEPTYGQAVSDLNRRFKAETNSLRDLVQQSVSLQARIDKAKQTYEELLRGMQTLTEQLSAKQAEVEDLQKQLQAKLGEFDSKVEPPVEDLKHFEAFFEAMSRAGVQLDAEAE